MHFAPLYPVVYRVLQPLFPQCLWSGNGTEKTIALTFDDGPHFQHTPELLAVLEHYQVTASFFWLGQAVEQYPPIAKATGDRGHWLGLHGYEHRDFPSLTAKELQQSLSRTQILIQQACQIEADRVRDVRPPYGLFTPHTLELLQQWNYRPVQWSVVPEDWVEPGVEVVVNRILQQIHNGSIIVLHEGIWGGASVAKICDRLLPLVLKQGYRFVTIDELWQQVPSIPPTFNQDCTNFLQNTCHNGIELIRMTE